MPRVWGRVMMARPAVPASESHGIVVALGGNALLPAGETGDVHLQFAHARESLAPIVALAAEGWRIAIVHGNGPQIGDDLLRNERARDALPPLPLEVLVAGTAGWMGYMIQQSLANALERAGVRRKVVTLITQVEVDPDDPDTRRPAKPIGRIMDEAAARRLAAETGWVIGEVEGGWRRLAPSPRPLAIVEADLIASLLERGTIVIAAGGGGTPVCRTAGRGLEGVGGVIDKDRAAQVLARDVDAELLLILTNVDGVYHRFGTPEQVLMRRLSVAEAEALLASGALVEGSMEPKVEAAVAFVRGGGRRAIIAKLDSGLAAVRGDAGTCIEAGT